MTGFLFGNGWINNPSFWGRTFAKLKEKLCCITVNQNNVLATCKALEYGDVSFVFKMSVLSKMFRKDCISL